MKILKNHKNIFRLMVLNILLFAVIAAAKPLSGAFVQISDYMAAYSQADWNEEIRLMSEAGLDTLIIAPSIADGIAHYPSTLPFVTQVADNGVTLILTACDAYNVKCYVGLVNDGRWWSSVGKGTILASLAANDNACADELLPLVNQHASFAGWYMTEEILFHLWGTGGNRTQLISTLLNPVVNHLKSITPGKPVATAPFVSTSSGATNCYNWWNYTLGLVDFDIVMLQDGFGANPNRQPEEIYPYFNSLQQACNNCGVEFWNDLETFNEPDWSARTFADGKLQITLNEKYVNKIVTWEWFYITPTQRMRNSTRTTDRQNFYVKMLAHNKGLNLVSLNKSYNLSETPSSSYPDVKRELTDSQIDFEMDSQVGFYHSSSQQVSVTIDLRENISARYGFAATMMKMQSWGAYLPSSVQVYASQDNVNFTYISQLSTYPASGNSLNVYFDFPQNSITARYIKFNIQSSNWLMCSELSVFRGAASGDFNVDDKVDLQDIAVLAGNWLDTNSEGTLFNFKAFAECAENLGWQKNAKEFYRSKFYKLKNTQVTQDSIYMQGRSAESIASELSVNGMESVFLLPNGNDGFVPGMITALHDRGIGAGLMLFASSVYGPKPAGWQAWRMEFLGSSDDSHVGFIHPGYREWMKQRAVNICNANGIDAITFAEPMYPIYDGIIKNPIVYADVSSAYQEIFKADTGESNFPDFTNPSSPDYFETNIALYQKLVEHRIGSITNYFDEIVNGTGGLRQSAPDTLVVTWSLACSKKPNGGVQILPEWEGNDAYSIVKKTKPDIHYYQTHWPDWCDPTTTPEHVYKYVDNFKEAWRAMPDVRVGVQDDFGSKANTRRGDEYYSAFLTACQASNVSNSTYYCFDIRPAIYEDAPQLKRISQFVISSDIANPSTCLRGAAVNTHANSSGNLNLRVHCKDSVASKWFFISEIVINDQTGGFTYTISSQTPPYSGRPDDNYDLSNGTFASANFDDIEWVEWAPSAQVKPPYADIVLHLQPNAPVNIIELHLLKNEGAGIYLPEIIEVNGVQHNFKTLNLEFDQRIDSNSAALIMQRTIVKEPSINCTVLRASVDGNLLKLWLDQPVQRGDTLLVDVSGIRSDMSARWVNGDNPAENVTRGTINIIPNGTIIGLKVE
ncbi:MAG: DUF4434 domain-containing protein [Phycisphaerales bacterium]